MALQELPYTRVGLYQWTGAAWARERGFFHPVSIAFIAPFGSALALSRDGNQLAIAHAGVAEDGPGVAVLDAWPGISRCGLHMAT